MDSIGTTLTASFFDSLNPSAFAQQMLLQAMVRRKRYIWFFIAGIGLANFAMGLAIYYGIAAWASRLLAAAVEKYPLYTYGAELLLGFLCLRIGVRLLIQTRKSIRAGGCGPEETAQSPAYDVRGGAEIDRKDKAQAVLAGKGVGCRIHFQQIYRDVSHGAGNGFGNPPGVAGGGKIKDHDQSPPCMVYLYCKMEKTVLEYQNRFMVFTCGFTAAAGSRM